MVGANMQSPLRCQCQNSGKGIKYHTARRQLFALQVGFAVAAAHLEEELVVLATARVLDTNSKAHDRTFEVEKRIAPFKSKVN